MEEKGPPSPPTIFGKYELGRLLGCGAFAKVYLARNKSTGQSVAIKSVSRRKIVKGGFVAHVKREISIMHRVRHPNIVELLEVLATRTKIYFVMELAKGGELFSKVAKGRFSEDLSRRYFQQLITAVAYCHARGVFHRDLKPENLLLDDNWELKVSDFGLSAVRDQIRPDGLLHTLCGTPAYVAPEILAKKGYDGTKVDIWSCGVILFVLVAGYLPFNGNNLMAMYRKIYKGEFRCPKWTSPELRHLLSRLLDTNPDTRITVGDILDDPWFRKGYKQIQTFPYADPFFELKTPEDNNHTSSKFLNAFDIISLSPGLDLSGLFSAVEDCGPGYPIRSERFLSTETPGRIIERVEEVASGEDLAVTKRMELGARLEGRNGNCAKMIVIEVDRLTDELVVVHVKEKIHERGEGLVGPSQFVWRHKLRPQLGALIYEYPVRGVQ